MLTRRWFLGGLIAAPVVLQADRLMPIRGTPYDPWVRFQTWPIGEPQPMDEVLTTRGNTVTNSYGGVVRLSTFRRIRAEQAFPLHFEFTRPMPTPGLEGWEREAQGEHDAIVRWMEMGNWVPSIPSRPPHAPGLIRA